MNNIVIRDSDYIISDVKVKTLTPNFVTESLTGKVNAKSRGLHSMEFKFTITLQTDKDVRKFNALMLKLRGRLKPFILSLVDDTDGKGHFNPLVIDKIIRLTTEAPVGATSINISAVGGVEEGTMFQFPNDTKVYTILDTIRGSGAVEIFPAVRVAHDVNTTLSTTVEPFLRLTNDTYEVTYEDNQAITLTAKEVL